MCVWGGGGGGGDEGKGLFVRSSWKVSAFACYVTENTAVIVVRVSSRCIFPLLYVSRYDLERTLSLSCHADHTDCRACGQ